jgi:tRNA threonylcarbamoyl adenosine modification protein YjeE
MLKLELEGEAATLRFARTVAAELQSGDVIGLEGELGAGKTTFARGLVYGMGVVEEVAVTSPTFSLLHQYEGRLPITHADLYRLDSEAELEELGLEELLEEGGVLLVEWGRRFEEIAKRTVLWVELEITSEHRRHVRLLPQGTRGDAIIGALAERQRR